MEIKQKLKKLRQDRKLTQTEVAEYLGISAQTVSKWERGLLSPDIMLLPKIAVLYRCSIDSIFEMESSWGAEHRKAFEARIVELHGKRDYAGVYRTWMQEIELQPDNFSNYTAVMLLVYRQKMYDDETVGKMISLADYAERYCPNGHFRNQIYQTMMQICSESDKPNIKAKAKEYYRKLPMLRHNREVYAKYVMEGERLTWQVKENIFYTVALAQNSIWQLITPEMPPEEKLFYYTKATALEEAILDGKYGGQYEGQLLLHYEKMIPLFVQSGETHKAREYLNRFLTALERHFSESERQNYSRLLAGTVMPDPYFEKIETTCQKILRRMLRDPYLEIFKEEISAFAERYFAYFQ